MNKTGPIALAFVMAFAPESPADAGSFGWGRGTAKSCEEMYGLVNRDIDSFLDRDLAEISTLSSREARMRRRDEHEASIDRLYDALGAMHRWCVDNFALCADERREVERRGCQVWPGVVTYSLESHSASWTMNCTNDTLMMPAKCAEPSGADGWERTAVAYGWTGENYTGRLAIFVARGQHGEHAVLLARAMSNCREAGRWACSEQGSYLGRCFSIAHGDDNTIGGGTEINEIGIGTGDTLAAADQAALEDCRARMNVGCKIWNTKMRKCSD